MGPESAGESTRDELAPTGKLRAGINFGNKFLVHRNASGAAAGIAVDLANELARRLSLPLLLVTYETAGKMADGAKENAWDIAFLAAEPERADEINFTEAYLEIDTTCLVRKDSPLTHVSDLDRAGIRIAVSARSAYDLFLSRTLRHAELVRAASPSASTEIFTTGKADALAGIRPMLEDILRLHAGMRLLEGRYGVVQQAIGSPCGRRAAAAYLQGFVEEIKRSGVLAQILGRYSVEGVSIPYFST
jgi:polar amino acid transport system substrate-binding protein